MADRPAVTVTVVSFNHSAYVTEALDSIAAQSYRPLRVIVIDDASTDNTANVIAAWTRSSNLDVDVNIRSKNRGLCSNLNAALAQVTTPLFAYISADDRMLPDRLERQVTRWVDDGGTAAAVYSDAIRIDNNGGRLEPDYSVVNDWAHVPTISGDVYDHLLKHNWIPAASVLLNTAVVRMAGGYDEDLFYEDHDLWLRLARNGTILCVYEPLVEVRELTTSLGSTHFNATDVKYTAARLRIMLKNYGATDSGDEHLRQVMPVLAVKLWEAGLHPELARQALTLTARGCETPGLTARLVLLRAGVTREPRAFRLARGRGL